MVLRTLYTRATIVLCLGRGGGGERRRDGGERRRDEEKEGVGGTEEIGKEGGRKGSRIIIPISQCTKQCWSNRYKG